MVGKWAVRILLGCCLVQNVNWREKKDTQIAKTWHDNALLAGWQHSAAEERIDGRVWTEGVIQETPSGGSHLHSIITSNGTAPSFQELSYPFIVLWLPCILQATVPAGFLNEQFLNTWMQLCVVLFTWNHVDTMLLFLTCLVLNLIHNHSKISLLQLFSVQNCCRKNIRLYKDSIVTLT